MSHRTLAYVKHKDITDHVKLLREINLPTANRSADIIEHLLSKRYGAAVTMLEDLERSGVVDLDKQEPIWPKKTKTA